MVFTHQRLWNTRYPTENGTLFQKRLQTDEQWVHPHQRQRRVCFPRRHSAGGDTIQWRLRHSVLYKNTRICVRDTAFGWWLPDELCSVRLNWTYRLRGREEEGQWARALLRREGCAVIGRESRTHLFSWFLLVESVKGRSRSSSKLVFFSLFSFSFFFFSPKATITLVHRFVCAQ